MNSKTKKPKKGHRHIWEYSENVWKRNICKKCGEFQKFDPVLNPRKKRKP